jgi:hypothetical protein
VALGYVGFPTGSIFGAAALEDVDGDGDREVCVGTSTGLICLLDGDGSARDGWPRVLPPATRPPNPAGIHASPAIADLDGDGAAEIVVATNAGSVHAWHADGRPLAGWPVELPNLARAGYGDVALADVDGDGARDVVVTTEQGYERPALVAVYDAAGRPLQGWPLALPETCNAGAAVGNLGGDEAAEIVVATIGGDAEVYLLDGRTGKPLAGWPVRLRERTVNTTPLISDLDGDGEPDILIAALSTGVDSRAWIWAFDARGAELRGFPILLPEDEIARAAPAIVDLDNDGDLELLVATELRNTLHVWDLESLCEPDLVPWPALSGGSARTGTLMAERLWKSVLGSDRTERERPPRSGPAAEALSTISFTLQAEASVRLVIFDIQGKPVRKLLDHRLPPGEYGIHWDGLDDSGLGRASGIYFYQLSLDGRATTRQLLLLH